MADDEPDTLQATAFTVSQQELDVAFGHPAPMSNRVLLTLSGSGGRLSFLELAPNGTPHFRGAVFLNYGELVGLRTLIGSMLNLPPETSNVSEK